MWGFKYASAGLALCSVVLAGCGDGDDPGAAATEPDAQTSAMPTAMPSEDAPTGADGDGFCADLESVRDRLENFESGPDLTDTEAALETIEESADALRAIDPPAEIAEDWSTVVEAFEGVATSLRNLDTSDPATLAQDLEDLVSQMERQAAAIDDAGTRIDQYTSDECGFVIE